ncbi:hypothetical protein KVR01_002814 [Diaporthe batatas]|uniref:uncharacterized protein n=1 Tax=Diaporthe batatas TaxID=748121 RepID=UPI001D03BDB1|nr:uncharacterized protein KVR01_002814 [Diaporthe batatas]KAG8167125.1 hypothetical protein KVR01_002814 [Diaporthe batatas]
MNKLVHRHGTCPILKNTRQCLMSTDAHSVKAKVASDGPREAPTLPNQPDPQDLSGKELELKAAFKEAQEELAKMTREEKMKIFPWMKDEPPSGVPADKAMAILAEMEEQERREAEAEDEDEATGTGAGKAS